MAISLSKTLNPRFYEFEYICTAEKCAMKKKSLFLIVSSLVISVLTEAKPLNLDSHELLSPPPRIIRTCCSFGSDLSMLAIPFIKITEITSLEELGAHKYLGQPGEGNGIIYTRRGGFIDIGHLRDQADWTAYLYSVLLNQQENGCINLDLGREGGEKHLHISLNGNLSNDDLLRLAGRIAYDLSVWHEIATWFRVSYIPMIPERYSSFSVEDGYSNLLGVTLGIEALKSDLPYEKAMDQLIKTKLDELKVVKTEEETYNAMEAVQGSWWTREKALPSGKILKVRQTKLYSTVEPMLVPGWSTPEEKAEELYVPELTQAGEPLTSFYELEIKLGHKFPYRQLFHDEHNRIITQENFDTLINRVTQECELLELRSNKEPRSIIHEARKELRGKKGTGGKS
jgi:hypothetical protein